MPLELARVPISALPVGTVLTAPIFDPNDAGTKLLGDNIEINSLFLRQLEARGVDAVLASKRDLAAMQAGAPQGIAKKVADHPYPTVSKVTEGSREVEGEMEADDFESNVEPADADKVDRLGDTPTDRYDTAAMSDAIKQREQQVAYVDDLFVSLVKGDGSDFEALSGVCRESMRSVVSDKDLFLCLGLNPYNADYPARHSLHVSSVAISIGAMLGLDDQSLLDLGTGCLIHDVGMLKLDRRLYTSKNQLSASQLKTLAEHPILAMDALACPGVRISRIARIVAYQIHERCNGSGYPRGKTGDEIHSLAKIAAVADAYVALVSNRPHRRGMLPYFAIEKLLNSVPQGLFDPKAIRGLLHAISLFPIGSFVTTNGGRTARVVRATGETYMQPIIELWDEDHKQFEPELIDLTQESTIKITEATRCPTDGGHKLLH